MKFSILLGLVTATIVAVCGPMAQRVEAQSSNRRKAPDSSGIQSVSLEDVLAGNVPGRHVTNVGGTGVKLDSLGLRRTDYSVGLSIGTMQPHSHFIAPEPDRKNPEKGRVTYYFTAAHWLKPYEKDIKAGQVLLRPLHSESPEVESGDSPVYILTIYIPPQSLVPVETGLVQTTNVFEYIDAHPLESAAFAESDLMANSLFRVKSLQLQPGAKFTVPFPHPPIYMVVLRGPITINGARMEKDRIIAARGPGPRLNGAKGSASLVIGNPGQDTAAVLEIEIIARGKSSAKPANAAPPQDK